MIGQSTPVAAPQAPPQPEPETAPDAKAKEIALRPHTKTHKCPLLAKRQMDLGAIGVCAAKVSEAEVMVAAGIDAVLITSPVVTRDKIARVVELARRSSQVQIVVDNAAAVSVLDEAARQAKTTVGVVIDIDPGRRHRARIDCEPGRKRVHPRAYRGREMRRRLTLHRHHVGHAAQLLQIGPDLVGL